MSSDPHTKSSQSALVLAALGVVFGDIGTSPLYAFKEAFHGPHAVPPTPDHIFPVLSALFWTVMLIISVKYMLIVLRNDNDGEGGVLALTALAHRVTGDTSRRSLLVISAGIFAAALFYGDAIITPAISVLSAVEGLSIVAPDLHKLVIPITVGILIALFLIQKHGTGSVGKLFGPITIAWFITLGTMGLHSIVQTPEILAALHPMHAIRFAIDEPGLAFGLMSVVFLAITGGEALYADMGHFGAPAVRIAWFTLVFPCLMLNYLGQGALVLRDPAASANPFFLLAPEAFLLPVVVLATAATVIASQATISGAFSMTLQASRLGYLPRVRILHTSDKERGQIYIPSVNWAMLLGVLALVFAFKSSGALAAAYGIAVSGTEIITTFLTLIVTFISVRRWRWAVVAALVVFGIMEVGFLSSNITKFTEGGWFPLLLGTLIFIALTTWKKGAMLVAGERRKIDIPMEDFISGPPMDVPHVPGTAIYLTSDPDVVPSALFHNLKHYKVMHEQTVFLHVNNENTPYVAPGDRIRVEKLTDGMYEMHVTFGFREEPDIPRALGKLPEGSPGMEPMSTTFFVARSTIVDGPGALPPWQCALYSWMNRQSEGASTYYRLPANQVVELGTQIIL